MKWLSPLLVLIDYLEFYQDETELIMIKSVTLIIEQISQLLVTDQMKIYHFISNGFSEFRKLSKKHSVANWLYFSKISSK
jgi:hypothetical protein